MQKFIRIAAIVSASLMALYLLIILIILPFQQSIIQSMQLSYPEKYSNLLPIFPTAKFVFGCLTLACIVWLVFVCFGKSKSITSEILVLICLFIILPAIADYVSSIRINLLFDNGIYYYSAHSVVNSIYNQFAFIFYWAKAGAFAVCGMSIAFKQLSKKPRKLWDDTPVLNGEF